VHHRAGALNQWSIVPSLTVHDKLMNLMKRTLHDDKDGFLFCFIDYRGRLYVLVRRRGLVRMSKSRAQREFDTEIRYVEDDTIS
jgi:hypothetical protein